MNTGELAKGVSGCDRHERDGREGGDRGGVRADRTRCRQGRGRVGFKLRQVRGQGPFRAAEPQPGNRRGHDDRGIQEAVVHSRQGAQGQALTSGAGNAVRRVNGGAGAATIASAYA